MLMGQRRFEDVLCHGQRGDLIGSIHDWQMAALLKAGAKPDVSDQKYDPLSAAAFAGDVTLTQM